MINDRLKISIVVPAFKIKYLQECIDSILAQTYKKIELIIINDASPEDIDSVVNQYNDLRIKYYKNEKGFGGYNVIKNWNKCLKYATGDFLICMGDDDKLLPNCLSDYVRLIEKYPGLDIYHSRTCFINEKSEYIGIQTAAPEIESVYSLIWHVWNGRETLIGDFLFRTKSLRTFGGFYYEPWAWHSDRISVFIAAKEKGIANTSNPGFLFRKNPLQITFNSRESTIGKIGAMKDAKQWYKTFLGEVPKDEFDKIYYKLLKDDIENKIDSFIAFDVLKDVSGSFFRLIFWIKNRKKYGLENSIMYHIYINFFLNTIFSIKHFIKYG